NDAPSKAKLRRVIYRIRSYLFDDRQVGFWRFIRHRIAIDIETLTARIIDMRVRWLSAWVRK
ncbi:hypothetical protein, partial [Dyella lipolytica]|uniref:hypothetical protein n=1 Tax=Dyella lipolytica TaxID=1867835 RepID=UPI0024E15010